jgi:low temperature requirement protein LtrA
MATELTPPRLPEGEGTVHRHATWLELFFDLVFVVAVAELSHKLVRDTSAEGFLEFVVLFVPVWWAWVGFTFYATRFESDDALYRLLWLTAMLGAAAMAVNVGGAFDGDGAAFAISYAAVRTVLVVLYLIARLRVPAARELSTFLAVGFTPGLALWYASALVDEPVRFWLWGTAMAVEGLMPLLGNRVLARTGVHPWHLPERFGLFMIIVLGESVAAVVAGTADTDWHVDSAVVAGAAFVAAASLWWSYFDFAAWSARIGLLTSERTGALARDIYSYGHFPVVVGLTLLGSGTELAIVETPGGSLGSGARWALCGGVALYLCAISLIYAGMTRSVRAGLWWPRFAAAGVAVALAAFGDELAPALVVGLLAATLVVHVVLEITTSEVLEQPQEGPFGGARVPAAFARGAMVETARSIESSGRLRRPRGPPT